MSKKLVTNSIYYTLGKMLPMAVAFIMVPIYTTYLVPSDYGIVNSMKILADVLTILFSLSIETSLFRLYYDYKDEKSQRTFIGTAFILISLSTIIGTGLLFLFQDYVVIIFKDIPFNPFFVVTFFSMLLGVFQIVPRIIFVITEKGKIYFIVGVIHLILSLILNIIYIVVLDEKAIGVLKALLLTNLLILPLYFYYQLKYSKIKLDLQIAKNILKFSLPLLPASLSTWIMNSSNRIFIDQYFSQTEVGIFSLGFRITFVFIMIITSLRLAYNPVYFRLAAMDDQKKAVSKIYTYNQYYLIISILMCFIISFFSRELIGVFLNKDYFNAWIILSLLTYSNLFLESSAIFRMALYQNKSTFSITIIVILTALISLLLNWILISKWGMYGAAYSSIISSMLLFYSFYFVSKKRGYFIKVNWLVLSTLFVAGLIINIVFWIINIDLILMLFIKIITIIILGFITFHLYKNEIKHYIDMILK